jgi:hypothetical protein
VTALQSEVVLKGFMSDVTSVGKVVHWTNYVHQTMSGYLHMLMIVNHSKCAAEYNIEPKPSTDHFTSLEELTPGFERYKSLPTRLHEKVVHINKTTRLLLSRIGNTQKCSNLKHM